MAHDCCWHLRVVVLKYIEAKHLLQLRRTSCHWKGTARWSQMARLYWVIWEL